MGQAFRNFKYRCKGRWVKLYLSLLGCKVGKGLKCLQIPNFREIPNKNIFLGENVMLGENITLEVVKGTVLKLGSNVNLTRNVTLAVSKSIEIGANCLIGENVSIRDTNHKTNRGSLILTQGFESEAISVGEDVWIGANSVILKGSTIPKGVVIGANSLVLNNSSMEAYGIYGGTPLRFLKMRK